MSETMKLALPLLSAGQSLREQTLNEALTRIDMSMYASILEPPRNSAPTGPADGDSYLVGTSPSGEWAGRDDQLACFTQGGWRYLEPVVGMRVHNASSGLDWQFDGTSWSEGVMAASAIKIGSVQVVGAQQMAIAAPIGGSVIDVEARSAISSILAAMENHGLISTS